MRRLVAATAYASGSIANLGPGFDVLGMALTGAGDRVTARLAGPPGLRILEAGHPDLPRDPEKNAAGVAALAVLTQVAQGAQLGIELTIEKGLPLSAGQGGSSASAVAAVVAVDHLLGTQLSVEQKLAAALEGEARVAGRHLDNLSPILLGGAVLVRSVESFDVVRLPTPPTLRIALALPDYAMRTADARAVLPREVPLATVVHQTAQIASLVAALASGDLALLGRALGDRMIEPVRAPLLRGFREAQAAALAAGALGASIAGSGPTIFAFVDGSHGDDAAERVASAMADAYRKLGIAATGRVARVDTQGAHIEFEDFEETAA